MSKPRAPRTKRAPATVESAGAYATPSESLIEPAATETPDDAPSIIAASNELSGAAMPSVIDQASGDGWHIYQADSFDAIRGIESDSVGFTIFSPPFASLYTYSDSERDAGNCVSMKQFIDHYDFLAPELLRITMSGRHCAVHCMPLPTSKSRDGYIGLQDFRGALCDSMLRAGWIYHCEVAPPSADVYEGIGSRADALCERFGLDVTARAAIIEEMLRAYVAGSEATSRPGEVIVWKDPVTQMQRTHALGLLHKTIRTDSSMSRMGLADYVMFFRKPGENPQKIKHTATDFPVKQWQEWASPVWTNIDPSDTLQARSARGAEDERHICPLQLEVIRRCLVLYSNPGDIVFTPFLGIGSELFMALGGTTKAGLHVEARRAIGIELKTEYFQQAKRNLMAAKSQQIALPYEVADGAA